MGSKYNQTKKNLNVQNFVGKEDCCGVEKRDWGETATGEKILDLKSRHSVRTRGINPFGRLIVSIRTAIHEARKILPLT